MPVEPTVLPKVIVLKGRLHQRHEEYPAGGAINPGYMLKVGSTGTVVAHATAGGNHPLYFAKEDSLQGRSITDAYANNDPVFVHIPERGDRINAKLAASAAAIVIGDPITSAGNGTVKKATGSDLVFAEARQAVDNSAGGSEAFIDIEIV